VMSRRIAGIIYGTMTVLSASRWLELHTLCLYM